MDLLRERAQDIRNLQNNQVPIKEKIRQIIETDSMNQLYQAKKLNQNDLLQFQEAIKFILKIIAVNFELLNLEPTLASTTKNVIELYLYYGLPSKVDQLQNELFNQSKQSIFLILLQHLIDITRMALEFTIKRQTNLRIFCVGKEIDKKQSTSNPPKRLNFKSVQRSESNTQEKVIQSKQSIFHFETQSPNESPAKTQRILEEIQATSRDNSVIRCYQIRQTDIVSKTLLPSIYQPKFKQQSLFRQLKQRNLSIQNTIQSYIKQINDKNNTDL
ncbi:unnamed protein product [Paramecium sonneborni]|uniref:Uncharacterized protein n=1 Tax=Paramecium sonneborni TaxID=65129 RepID=A0A8S1PDG5_9CILI|nr:unnamed protein product [Paramecium sonneborni]